MRRSNVTSASVRQIKSLVGDLLLGAEKESALGAALRRTMATQPQRCLELDNLNPNIITLEYAVRGPLVTRAGEIEKELEKVCHCTVCGPCVVFYFCLG